MPLIRFDNLSYAYPAQSPDAEAPLVLEHISLEIEQGEALALMGPTGAGKTTLCLALNGIIPHLTGGWMEGSVLTAGYDTRTTLPAALASQVGFVYQDPDSQLFCTTVEEEVAFGLENQGIDPHEIDERLDWALHIVGLQACRQRSPARLSGGQKMRLAIACSLALLPKILILDETGSSLDPAGQAEVFAAVETLRREHHMTLIMVSTDAERIAYDASRIAVLIAGRLVACGEPRQILGDKALLESAGIAAPQMMKLAWQLNAHCQNRYQWLGVDEAEPALRSRIVGGRVDG